MLSYMTTDAGRLAVNAIVTVALLIATAQMLNAKLGTLTPWKGGGFGMFSSIDSPTNRALVIRGIEADTNKTFRLRPAPTGTDDEALGWTSIARTTTKPSVDAMTRVGTAALLSGCRDATLTSGPRSDFLSREFRPLNSGFEHREPSLELLGSGRGCRVLLQSVQVDVYRLRYSSESSTLSLEAVLPTVTVSRPR